MYPYISTYSHSGHRWLSSMIGEAPGEAHWNHREKYHLEAVVVIRWDWTSLSPKSTIYNSSCDIQAEFVRQYSSSSWILEQKWEDRMLPGHENPCTCVDPEEIRMRWCQTTPWSPEYVLSVAQPTAVTPIPPITRRLSITMCLEAVIERVEIWTWRPTSSEHRDALSGRDTASLEMHLQTMIEQDSRSTWKWSIWSVVHRHWGSIHWLACHCGNVESWVQHHPLGDGKQPGNGKLAGSRRLSILG